MTVKPFAMVVLAAYLLALCFFAFRPFEPIPGKLYPKVPSATDGVVKAGAALEDPRATGLLLDRLTRTGTMSLEVLLKTASLRQGGPARIITFSNHNMSRNFTLAQEGDGLSFRLRTSETDGNGMYPHLLVPGVFVDGETQHIVVTYDGAFVRLFVDGQEHPTRIALGGDFSNWGRNHLLMVGDEAAGGRPWEGEVKRFRVFDRALGSDEVELLHGGGAVDGAVYSFPEPHGMRPLRYRNLFVHSDPIFTPWDCISNIIGFIPLALLMFVAFPSLFRKRITLVVPVLAGLGISATFELVQRGIVGRVPCLADLAYNVLGSVVGTLMVWLMLKHPRFSPMIDARGATGEYK